MAGLKGRVLQDLHGSKHHPTPCFDRSSRARRAVLPERVRLCFDERVISEYRDVFTRPRFLFNRELKRPDH